MIIGDRIEWYLDLDLVWHSSEARIAFVPPVLVKDRQLHWVLGKSRTYYSEHILVYGRREDLLLSCRGFWLFPDRLIGGGDGGCLSTTLSPGLRCGGLKSKFGQGLRPLDMSGMGWSHLCLGYKRGMCFGVPNWAH